MEVAEIKINYSTKQVVCARVSGSYVACWCCVLPEGDGLVGDAVADEVVLGGDIARLKGNIGGDGDSEGW